MTAKYKAGDRVEVVIDDCNAASANIGGFLAIMPSQITAHHPAPDPVVRWHNVYPQQIWQFPYISRKKADKNAFINRTCVLRLEWADGDTSKKPSSVTVEDV